MPKSHVRASASALFFLVTSLIAGPSRNLSAQALAGPASLQVNRVADNVDLNARAQVAGHIPAWATPAADAGAVTSGAPQLLTFDIARSPEVQAAFEQLLADQQNPASPRYHQWLTPQQVGDQYGPTQHDLDAFTAWLTGQGFAISSVAPSRIFVQATATTSIVSTALQTSLHSFNVNGNKLQAPLTEPALPAAFAPMVKFVSGLTTIQSHTFSNPLPPVPVSVLGKTFNSGDGSVLAAHPDYTLGGGTVHYLAPADFNLIYDITPSLTAGITGTGQRVAIIGGSRLLASDVTSFESLAALASYQPNYVVPAGLTDPGVTSNSNQAEATLDFERVYGTAPASQVDLVISLNSLSTDTDTLQLYAINTLNDPVLSMSYGACEYGNPASYAQHENALFSQAIAQGISVFASSGDSGIAGCEAQGATPAATQVASIQIPCDSAYLTCVGGTQFSDTASPTTYWSATNGTGKLSALSYIPEGGWNEPTTTNTAGATVYEVLASTGGPSASIPKPSWQTGSGVPADGVRDTPDVSFSASGHNAYFSCLAYLGADCTTYLTGFAGTSASAPSMAGMAALIDQKLGKRQGLLNPVLYATAVSTPAAFHDATPATSGVSSCTVATPSTCNNSDPGPSSLTGGIAGYPLLTGYDFPTGLGSLDFGKFLGAISLPTPSIVVTATPSTITISQTVTLTATVTAPGGVAGQPTGTVQFSSNGTALGSPVALVNGTATTGALSNFTLASTYSITAAYSGDTVFSPVTSSAYSLVVTNPAAVPSSVSLVVSPIPATTLQATTLTATVKGSASAVPTGTVQFYDNTVAKGAPITLVSGVASLAAGSLTAGTHSITCLYSGDNNYSASSCTAVFDTVTALTSTTVETLSAASITYSGSTILSYTVASPSGGTPTGSVTAYAVETSPVPTAAVALGVASLTSGAGGGTLSGLTPGVYTIYGTYSGDSTYAPSTSQNLTLSVSGFGMAASASSLSLTDGATTGNSVILTYTSIAGFTGTIVQSCTVTPTTVAAVPIPPTCSFAPASVSLTGASATSTVTIGSSANAVTGGLQTVAALRAGALGGVSLAGLLLVFSPKRRRLLGNWRALSIVVLLSAALFTVAGCGTGSGAAITGTNRGAYTLTVTGTSGGQTSTTTTALTIN